MEKLFLNKENIENVEKEFLKIGINLKDTTGEFRSMYDVLKDCSEVWGSLPINFQKEE